MRKDVPACEWVAARVLNEGGGEGCGRVVADYGQYCELGEKNAKMRRCGNVIRLMRYGVSGGSESALGDGDMADSRRMRTQVNLRWKWSQTYFF